MCDQVNWIGYKFIHEFERIAEANHLDLRRNLITSPFDGIAFFFKDFTAVARIKYHCDTETCCILFETFKDSYTDNAKEWMNLDYTNAAELNKMLQYITVEISKKVPP